MPNIARPPRLSDLGVDLVCLTRWQVARAVGWPVFAFVAYWLFATWQQWPWAVLSLVILSFTTYGSTSHDLVHGNLGLRRRANDWLLAILEGISLRSGHAYQLAHLHHHARFPAQDDIEAAAARMSLARALLEGVVFQIRVYTWALRQPRGRRMWIIGEGIAVAAIVLGALLASRWTIAPGVYVALMIVGSWIIPLVTAYFPHDADAPDAASQTRVFRGMVARVLAFDHLYHWEHHQYPTVPHQNWPVLARRLDPWLQAAGVKWIRLGF